MEIQDIDLDDTAAVMHWFQEFSKRQPGINPADLMMLGIMSSHFKMTVVTRDAAYSLLDKIAVAINGEPAPGESAGYGDLLEQVVAAMAAKKGVH